MVAEFPTNTYRGAVSFREALGPFARIVKHIDVLCLVVDGEHCVALLNIETVFGVIPFAEHIQVVRDEIVFVRGYCDPRPMVFSVPRLMADPMSAWPEPPSDAAASHSLKMTCGAEPR